MPPLYKETIVLCLDNDGMWLWLQNYEDVLFVDGSPNDIISLKIGLGIFEERLTFPNLMKRWSLSQWLDVPEVINFQQQILANRNRPSQPKSNLYSLGLILAALKAIGLAPQGDAEPTDGTQPDDLIKKYLAEYTNKKYPRSWWEAIPIKDQKYPEFKYRAKVESLLSPKQYKKYEQELGFVGYFPKPCWVRQEQQAELRDAKSPRGTTRNHDPRDIKPAKSHILKNIPSQWEWQKIPDEIFAHVDKLLQKEKGKEKAKTSSSSTAPNISGGATPGTKHGQLRRIDCYGFRGDTRDPIAVQAAQGFFCNATRSDVEDKEVKEKVALVDAALEKAKKKHNIETLFAALIETGVLNLGAYTGSPDFGGFVSATISIAIAKSFTNNWHEYVPKALRDDKDKFNSQNFCYALHCVNGFVLPSNRETKELRQIHEFAQFAEQEVAVPGMIGWNEVVGFRMCLSRAMGAVLAGPVWIPEKEFDAAGFQTLYDLLSGRPQGSHPAINGSYGTITQHGKAVDSVGDEIDTHTVVRSPAPLFLPPPPDRRKSALLPKPPKQ